jgi:hypothetical protein
MVLRIHFFTPNTPFQQLFVGLFFYQNFALDKSIENQLVEFLKQEKPCKKKGDFPR